MFFTKLLALLMFFMLSGCSSTTTDFYLYGLGNSCFNGKVDQSCTKIKAYDKVKLSISVENQTVTFVKSAYNLDATNVVFKNLENCIVVDVHNFSCDGFSKAAGKFLNTDIVKPRIVTESYLLSLSSFFDIELEVKFFKFINNNQYLISVGLFLLIFVTLIRIFLRY